MILPVVIAPGRSMPAPISGTRFEVVSSASPLSIRPEPWGVASTYIQQTGESFQKSFDGLTIINPNPVSIVAAIFIGDGDFIDRRLLPSPQQPNVPVGTYIPIIGHQDTLLIPDQSGAIIKTYIPGTETPLALFYAVQRLSIFIVSSADGLQGIFGDANFPIPTVPNPALKLDFGGDFNLYNSNLSGFITNPFVLEIYQGIPAI